VTTGSYNRPYNKQFGLSFCIFCTSYRPFAFQDYAEFRTTINKACSSEKRQAEYIPEESEFLDTSGFLCKWKSPLFSEPLLFPTFNQSLYLVLARKSPERHENLMSFRRFAHEGKVWSVTYTRTQSLFMGQIGLFPRESGLDRVARESKYSIFSSPSERKNVLRFCAPLALLAGSGNNVEWSCNGGKNGGQEDVIRLIFLAFHC